MVKKGDEYTVLIKVRWSNLNESTATWENYYEMEKKFPSFMAHKRLEARRLWGSAGCLSGSGRN